MDDYDNINTTALAVITNKFASTKMIDATNNMFNDRVLILSGLQDFTVLQGDSVLCCISYFLYNIYIE